MLTIFCRCDYQHFSSRTSLARRCGNKPSMVLAEHRAAQGLAMLIRSQMNGIWGEAAEAASVPAIPAASLPTLLIGRLLLLICP
jgi:hypothetical protein